MKLVKRVSYLRSSNSILMTSTQLPEDVIVSDILVKLPVESLLRFTSVSKRYRSIISHPHFAASHFQPPHHRSRRLLLFSSVVESVDLQTTPSSSSFSSSLTSKLSNQPETSPSSSIKLLGSSNGLVCLCTDDPTLTALTISIWNPSTGFCRVLPSPCFSSSETQAVLFGGFGYLSASDDYKFVVAVDNVFDYGESVAEVKLLSWRTRVWRTVVVGACGLSYTLYPAGVLVGEALHWFRNDRGYSAVVAFDLGKEEFREMRGPPKSGQRYDRDYVHCVDSLGGKLHVFRYPANVCDVLELWRMRQYGDGESWMEVFRFSLVDEPRKAVYLRPFLLAEGGGAVVAKVTRNATMEMVRIDEPDGGQPVVVDVLKRGVVPAMIVYEESLHRLPGCDVEDEKVEEIRKPLFHNLLRITDRWYVVLALVGFLVSLYYIPVNDVQMFLDMIG